MTNSELVKWDSRFLKTAALVGSWSKDPSTKCGCVIADGKLIVSTGYNGYPSGIKDNPNDSREVKLAKTIHAEVNAILYAKRDLSGCTLYITPIPPCSNCAAIITQSGISRVVIGIVPELDIARWEESAKHGFFMLKEKGIVVQEVSV
jgi:dCMP deaminase